MKERRKRNEGNENGKIRNIKSQVCLILPHFLSYFPPILSFLFSLPPLIPPSHSLPLLPSLSLHYSPFLPFFLIFLLFLSLTLPSFTSPVYYFFPLLVFPRPFFFSSAFFSSDFQRFLFSSVRSFASLDPFTGFPSPLSSSCSFLYIFFPFLFSFLPLLHSSTHPAHCLLSYSPLVSPL